MYKHSVLRFVDPFFNTEKLALMNLIFCIFPVIKLLMVSHEKLFYRNEVIINFATRLEL